MRWAVSSLAAWPPAKATCPSCAAQVCKFPSAGGGPSSPLPGCSSHCEVGSAVRTSLVLQCLALLLLAALTMSASPAHAEGDARPLSFVDLKGTKHVPLDTKGARAVVFFFVVADCPVANYYTSEINAIIKDHAGKPVRFFVVHVDPDLTPAAARAHAKEYGITCPVLIDAKHDLVKATGATITPEAVILTPGGKIAYRGRIDDRYVELGKRRIAPTRRDVRDALAALLAGRPVKEPRNRAIGCPVPDLVPPRGAP